jgi:hypothetical protein
MTHRLIEPLNAMQPVLHPLKLRPGCVSPVCVFGADVKARDGRVVASFATHGRAFRAFAVADGRGGYPDWAESLTPDEWATVLAINSYLAREPEYRS